jgi:hypothetical protein
MVVEKFVEFKEPRRKKKNLTQKTQRRKGSDLERAGFWS